MLESIKSLLSAHFDTAIKLVIALSLVCIASSVSAGPSMGGTVGISSDYIFRGQSQHVGNHQLSASLDAEWGGIYGSVWVSEVDFGDGKASHEIDTVVGLKKDWEHIGFNVAYIDYAYNGDSSLDYEEILLSASILGVTLSHYMGQDDAGDYTEFSTGMLKVVDVAYGDGEGIGTHWTVSKGFDLLKGHVTLGWSDFTADDFSGMIDEDSLFVSYNYHF
jgi:uncharacterized protein (TIGR02001 family)|tara:strand:+ start:896 stop:1552 length:657 start_codon:yes stop_codon:yes gene_type:complete